MELKDIAPLAITFLVTVIILGLGAIILTGFQNNMQDLFATQNVSLTWAGNNTAMSLTESRVETVTLYNNGTVLNYGGGVNYTFTSGTLTIINQTSNLFNGTLGASAPNQIVTDKLNATIGYRYGSVARNTTGFGMTSLNTIASYMPLLALISIAAVVVGIVLVMFVRKKEN